MPPPVASAERFLGVRFTRPAAVSCGDAPRPWPRRWSARRRRSGRRLVGERRRRSVDRRAPGRLVDRRREPKAPGTLSSSDSAGLGGRRAGSALDRAGSELVADERLQAPLELVAVGDGVEVGARLLGQLVEVGQLGQAVVDARRPRATRPRRTSIVVGLGLERRDLGLEVGLGQRLLELVELELAAGGAVGGHGGIGLGIDDDDVVDRRPGRRGRRSSTGGATMRLRRRR